MRSPANADSASKPVTRFAGILASGGSARAEIRVDGKLYSMPVSFLWDPGSVHDVEVAASFPNGSDQSLRVFQKWSDGAERVRKITALSDTTAYTATYGIKFALGLARAGSGTITVSPDSADGYFDQGSTIAVTAVPAAPAQFVGWGNDFWGRDNPFSITMAETFTGFAFFQSPRTASGFGVADTARNRVNIMLSSNQFVPAVAPGELVLLYSPDFGPDGRSDATADDSGSFPTNLAGVRALFNGEPAPLVSVAKGQVTAMAPYSIAQQSRIALQLEYQGIRTAAAGLNVFPSNPSIYTADNTGQGSGACDK